MWLAVANVRKSAAFANMRHEFFLWIEETEDKSIVNAAKYPDVVDTEVESNEDAHGCPLSQQTGGVLPHLLDYLFRCPV